MSGNSLLYDVVIRETTILQDYRCTCGSVAFKLFQASELIESRLQIKIRGLVVKRNGSAGVRTPAIYLTLFVQELGTAARLHVQCEGRYPYVFADLFGPGPVTGFAGKPDRGLRLQRSPPGSERRQLALIAVKPGVTLDPIFLDAGSSERLKQSQKTKSPERWMVSTSSTCGDLLQHFPHIVQEKCLSFCTSIVLGSLRPLWVSGGPLFSAAGLLRQLRQSSIRSTWISDTLRVLASRGSRQPCFLPARRHWDKLIAGVVR